MKRKKLRGFVLPTLYLLITISIFTGIILLGRNTELQDIDYDYSMDVEVDNVESVVVEAPVTTSNISSPVSDSKAQISIHFYSKDSDEETQQSSLIYYQNTYLPNTGILYTGDDTFEIKTVFPGKVSDILDDEFFGKCIVIEHENNLK